MTRYSVIVADPPWAFSDKLTMSAVARGAEANYPTMRGVDIAMLPVRDVVADNAVLSLWVPSSLLVLGCNVMQSWGFELKQTYVWRKLTKAGKPAFGMGRLFRQCHELALVGTRGSPYAALCSRSERSVVSAVNEGHSVKPDALHESLERMFPEARKLELFARRSRAGWTCLGNEIDGRDIREALALEAA